MVHQARGSKTGEEEMNHVFGEELVGELASANFPRFYDEKIKQT